MRRTDGEILVVVGIAPGRTEIAEGEPFVGASGKILRRWLGGIDESVAVYLTNAVKCGIQTPAKDHRMACAPDLLAELDSINPNYVLCLGQIARQQVVSIGWSKCPVAFAPHPATVLYRQYTKQAWNDEATAAWAELRAKVGHLSRPAFDLGAPVLGVDTEYKGEVHDGFDMAVVGDGKDSEVFTRGQADLLTLRLARAKCVVFHHAVNDLISLWATGVKLPGDLEVDCTMTARGVLMPGASRDLKTVTSSLGYVSPQPNLTMWKNGKVPDEEIASYCEDDVRRTLLLWSTERTAAMAHPLYRDTYRPLLKVLAGMSRIEVDLDLLKTITSKLEIEQGEVEAQLGAYASINWYSNPQVSDYLTQKGVDLPQTDLGQPSVDESVLRELEADHPESRLLLRAREIRKILGTYCYPMTRAGCLMTVYDPVGTRTGRMASRNVNIQNIPRWLRAVAKPRDGCRWVTGDYSAHEIRTAAWISQDQVMLDDVLSADFHAQVAMALGGKAIESEEERTLWKAISFASIYLGTDKTVQEHLKGLGIELSEDDACEYVVKFWERYRGYLAWIDRLKARARSDGQIITPFGRAFRASPTVDLSYWRQVVNAIIQGTAADFTARALLRCVRAGMRPLVTVHDSISVEASAADAEEVARTLKDIMQDDKGPLAVKVTVSDRWGEIADAE